MNNNRIAFKYASSQGGGINPPHTGLIPDVLPEAQKSVWVKNLRLKSLVFSVCAITITILTSLSGWNHGVCHQE